MAERLEIPFADLDRHFAHRHGDISEYIQRHGYRAYVTANIGAYASLLSALSEPSVVALSSGFMTYAPDIHAAYSRYRNEIANHSWTFVLIPSLDVEACIRETVRRQLTRPFARSHSVEESVIRERFHIYVDLPARKIETMRPLPAIVSEIVLSLQTATA